MERARLACADDGDGRVLELVALAVGVPRHRVVAVAVEVESDRVERKASISDSTKIRQAICAFANDLAGNKKPGVIFIGVNDNGTCSNSPITDQLLLTLANMRDDGNILPMPSLIVR